MSTTLFATTLTLGLLLVAGIAISALTIFAISVSLSMTTDLLNRLR